MSLIERVEISADEFNAMQAKQKPSKYRAVPTEVDGIRFASNAEARRYGELKFLLDDGQIEHLTVQPRLSLAVNGLVVGSYVGDFKYRDMTTYPHQWVIEDVKGVRTPIYRLKRKMVRAQYGIEIREVS